MNITAYLKYIPLFLLSGLIFVAGCGVQDPDGYNRQGVFLDSQGKNDEAIWNYKKALKIDPHNKDAHYNLAVAYHKKEMFKEAIEE
ncbi:MAG: tetratricopeptide repeat protein, partial [Candidatus Brocadiales bacterium]|nr:tetratricopeptide repeat protein [Candidatus Brocadiales bacterium]